MSTEFYKKQINLLSEKRAEDSSSEEKSQTRTSPARWSPPEDYPEEKSRQPRQSSIRKKLSLFFIFLIVIFSIVASLVAGGNNHFLAGVKNSYLVRQIFNILNPSEKYLAGEKDDRINFLLLGMGGPGHNGPLLTDTIVVASLEPSSKKAALFSSYFIGSIGDCSLCL